LLRLRASSGKQGEEKQLARGFHGDVLSQ
jgi:hypothetical protein